ncbi:MAG: electron transport complex subunit E [Clostridia bacterium]|nr:electron transport complex subunit E [Clostridia bacterium]
MAEKKSPGKEFSKGIIKQNPVLRLMLGTCATLAVTTSLVNGFGMGLSVTVVLVCSNIVISLLRKVIPNKVRIPAYILVIASFVTLVQMVVKAYVPALDKSLGIFLPLIVVNCIILGRAEAFAGKNSVLASALDGLGMGVGFTAACCAMGIIRELIGGGTFMTGLQSLLSVFGEHVLGGFDGVDFFAKFPILEKISLQPMTLFLLPSGGFFTFGILIAITNRIAEGKGEKKAELRDCMHCPMAAACGMQPESCEEAKEETA